MILIADDCQTEIDLLSDFLKAHNFMADIALSGHEALKKILNNDYTLILLKIQLPDLNGFEVAETFNGLKKIEGVPVLFISDVQLLDEDIAKTYQFGGWGYLVKPFSKEILYCKVQHALNHYLDLAKLKTSVKVLINELETKKHAEIVRNQYINTIRRTLAGPIASVNSYMQLALDAVKRANEAQATKLLTKGLAQLGKLNELPNEIENPSFKTAK